MITENTTFGELRTMPEFAAFSEFIMVQQPQKEAARDVVPLASCAQRTDLIVDAANWLRAESEAGRVYPIDLWTNGEKDADPEKQRTGLLFFPAKEEGRRPYVIVCAGGAYVSVCNALEAFPSAKVLTNRGYHVFVLTYRVASSPLLPKPQEDLAQAVRRIEAKAQELEVLPGACAVLGFSAGAHLAGSFGTDNLGYVRYGVPKPVMLILAYPATSAYVFDPDYQEGNGYINMMIGPEWKKELLDGASTECNMSVHYPPAFITHCYNDETVPFHSSELLVEKLKELQIPYRFKPVNGCGHGFSTGFGESQGWLEEACDFLEEQLEQRGIKP